MGNWRHPLLGRPIGSMVGPPVPGFPVANVLEIDYRGFPVALAASFWPRPAVHGYQLGPTPASWYPPMQGCGPLVYPPQIPTCHAPARPNFQGPTPAAGIAESTVRAHGCTNRGLNPPFDHHRPVRPPPALRVLKFCSSSINFAMPPPFGWTFPPSTLRTGDVTGCVWPSGSPLLSPILLYSGGPQSGHPPSRKIIDSLIHSARGVH